MARVLSWLVFLLLMAVILPGSFVLVVLFYVPYVAARAVYLMAIGKVKPRFLQAAAERARMDQPRETRSGPVPF